MKGAIEFISDSAINQLFAVNIAFGTTMKPTVVHGGDIEADDAADDRVPQLPQHVVAADAVLQADDGRCLCCKCLKLLGSFVDGQTFYCEQNEVRRGQSICRIGDGQI